MEEIISEHESLGEELKKLSKVKEGFEKELIHIMCKVKAKRLLDLVEGKYANGEKSPAQKALELE